MTITTLVWVIARLGLVAMFPFSALDKVWHWKNALAQTEGGQPPVPPPLLARAMLAAAILVEAVTPFMIVFGLYDRVGAFVLAGFCVVTAFMYHPFWRYPDFWSRSDDSVAREHFWQFLKNFGLVGGLILVMFAGDLAAPRAALSQTVAALSR